MKKLPYIEDYIVLLGDDPLSWPPKQQIIKLARYDEPIVNSMAQQVTSKLGFTDKQAALAQKIVTKYRKQWSAAGYDVTDHIETPRYKLPIRVIDRRQRIDLVDYNIEIRFPYDQDIISKLRASANESPGRLSWDPDKHCWITPALEQRVVWAKEFGVEYNFEFSTEFDQALSTLLSQSDFSICLQRDGSNFAITNAEISLLDYISENIGFDDLTKLVDYSSILGYEIDPVIKHELDVKQLIKSVLMSRTVNLTYTSYVNDFDQIVEYAKLTDRFPIFVYESGTKTLMREIEKCFPPDQVLSQGHHLISKHEVNKYKVVYFNHWKTIRQKMPLLVTMHTLLIGHRRQQVANLADKIVYYTQVVDNNE